MAWPERNGIDKTSKGLMDKLPEGGSFFLAPNIYDYEALQCSSHYGMVRWQFESSGKTIGSMDLLITAHALALEAIVVTNNESHFFRVEGLQIVIWLANVN